METRKINSLLDRLSRMKLIRDMEPDPDGLSLSLWECGAKLAALDDDGLAAEAEVLGITSDDVRTMMMTYAR